MLTGLKVTNSIQIRLGKRDKKPTESSPTKLYGVQRKLQYYPPPSNFKLQILFFTKGGCHCTQSGTSQPYKKATEIYSLTSSILPFSPKKKRVYYHTRKIKIYDACTIISEFCILSANKQTKWNFLRFFCCCSPSFSRSRFQSKLAGRRRRGPSIIFA